MQLNIVLNMTWIGQIPAQLSDITLEDNKFYESIFTLQAELISGSDRDMPVTEGYITLIPVLALRSQLHFWPLPQFLCVKHPDILR